jgi:hypothetical protein
VCRFEQCEADTGDRSEASLFSTYFLQYENSERNCEFSFSPQKATKLLRKKYNICLLGPNKTNSQNYASWERTQLSFHLLGNRNEVQWVCKNSVPQKDPLNQIIT